MSKAAQCFQAMLKSAVVAVAGAVAFHSGPATAHHSWNGYHWAKTSELIIRMSDNVSSDWDTYLRLAARDWHASAPVDIWVTSGWKNPTTCAPTFGRIEVCNAAHGRNGWLGIGNIWISDGHIVQGTVQLNDTYFSLAYYNTPALRRLVMCQEIGHVLGLDHQDVHNANVNLGTCMDYSRDPAGATATQGPLSNERPNKHDYDQLNQIYSHADSSQLQSTQAKSAAASAELPRNEKGRRIAQSRVGKSPAEWGRAVAFDARGRPRIFTRDLGGTEFVATFVIWAEDADAQHVHEH